MIRPPPQTCPLRAPYRPRTARQRHRMRNHQPQARAVVVSRSNPADRRSDMGACESCWPSCVVIDRYGKEKMTAPTTLRCAKRLQFVATCSCMVATECTASALTKAFGDSANRNIRWVANSRGSREYPVRLASVLMQLHVLVRIVPSGSVPGRGSRRSPVGAFVDLAPYLAASPLAVPISVLTYRWLKLRQVRHMADKHGPKHALALAKILFPRPAFPLRRRREPDDQDPAVV